jgi:hypothetical protein
LMQTERSTSNLYVIALIPPRIVTSVSRAVDRDKTLVRVLFLVIVNAKLLRRIRAEHNEGCMQTSSIG